MTKFFLPILIVYFLTFYKSTVIENENIPLPKEPEIKRGIHITGWMAGLKKFRPYYEHIFSTTEINTVVISVKECNGEVFIPGVKQVEEIKNYVNVIPDLEEYLSYLRYVLRVYLIARIVVFQDNLLPRKKPNIAVKKPDGTLWRDRKGLTWLDPYSKEAWEYNIAIAEQAIKIGFQEIQFDYIRFPADGDTSLCKYSYAQHNSSTAAKALFDFLSFTKERLHALNAKVSICLFGLTPSVAHDMGIGQKFTEIIQQTDYISLMVYPSHYSLGQFGIPNPDIEPYKTVHKSLSDAICHLGEENKYKIRPYLQDFSLKSHYDANKVRSQIQAVYDLGLKEWLLWNPRSLYTVAALEKKPIQYLE